MTPSLIKIFHRDLKKLQDEINQYEDEADLWVIKGNISNSAGNLCLHIIGNLNHFIGAVLGKNGYIRHRDLEFSQKNVPRVDMLANIDALFPIISDTLSGLSEDDLSGVFPVLKHDEVVTTELMLLHLLSHFQYHLGQINYHRRLIK
ncbi:MAG: DUF1572 domain-containing protein [Chitinophagales bacterium]|nr:DUF1572 domain-containing protein [Chitinophagales bacterium]